MALRKENGNRRVVLRRESGNRAGKKIRELLEDFLQPGFLSAVASGSVSADKMKKLKLRPVLAGAGSGTRRRNGSGTKCSMKIWIGKQ